LRMNAMPLADLVRNMSNATDRMVIDKTGLPGIFDLELRWSDTDGPSLVTAVQEQLGLKLEPQRGPVDVLMIDAAERPTED
jgi:bla regulator protein BlaR1